MTNPLDLSVILPCYNEHPVFESSAREIVKTLDHTTFAYEIIFVDSTCNFKLVILRLKSQNTS